MNSWNTKSIFLSEPSLLHQYSGSLCFTNCHHPQKPHVNLEGGSLQSWRPRFLKLSFSDFSSRKFHLLQNSAASFVYANHALWNSMHSWRYNPSISWFLTFISWIRRNLWTIFPEKCARNVCKILHILLGLRYPWNPELD
jgi:hypothetical protein